MPHLGRLRLRLRRTAPGLHPARRGGRRQRLAASAREEMRRLGVGRPLYLLMLPLLLLLVCLAAYWRVPRAVVHPFQPLNERALSPLGGLAIDARLDPADLEGEYRLVWAKATWRELEPEEDRYDFDSFEERTHFADWRARGARLILRIVLDSPASGEPMDIPEWLWEKTGDGQFYDLPGGAGYAPDYSNLTLQEAHLDLLEAVAERYARTGALAFVEMGSLGLEGRWETLEGGPDLPMADVTGVYIWQYATAFPDTVVLVPRPYRESALLGCGAYNAHLGSEEATWAWINLFAFGGWDAEIGENLRPDEDFGIASAAGAWVEKGLDLGTVLRENADGFRRMALECRPTYLCLEDEAAFADVDARAEMEDLAGEIGSRLWVRQASWPGRVRTDYSLYVDLTIRNDGIAPPPERWPVMLALMRNGELLCVEETGADLRAWREGDTALRVRITVPADFASGEYDLAFAVCDPHTGEAAVPFEMACGRVGLWHILGSVLVC